MGCFRNGCLGCLGLIVLLAVFFGAGMVLVKHRTGPAVVQDVVLGPESSSTAAPLAGMTAKSSTDKPAAGLGWLLLDLSQGGFYIHPGEPGAGVVVKASYDTSAFELIDYSHSWPDSSWVYQLRFHQTLSGFEALLHNIASDSQGPEVHVYIPPDLPIELNGVVKMGGLECELGGLWLTAVDLRYNMGGVELRISEPLREPLESLVLVGRMGGAEITHLGNASPGNLAVNCRMGGLSLDLAGAWRNDCLADVTISMGGMEITVPDNIRVVAAGDGTDNLSRTDQEFSTPVLYLKQTVEMGEIEVN